MKCEAYIDGSSLGNPGEAGYGVVIYESGNHSEYLMAVGVYIGQGTNNTAEYSGLLGCLKLTAAMNISELVVNSDSELLVRQVNGEYKVKQPHLLKMYNQICSIIKQSDFDFIIRHVPREKNKEADRLAKKAAMLKQNITG